MDYGEFGFKVLQILSPILLAVLTWASIKATQYIQAKVKNEYLRGALTRLNDAVLTAVREVQQVAVEAIKAGRADGKLTADEKAAVKKAALDSVKSHLGVKGVDELIKILGLSDGSIDRLLESKIEAAVHALKSSNSTSKST